MTGQYDLVADIGATHARFQLADRERLLEQPLILKTAQFDSAQTLLAQVRRELGVSSLGRVLFAIAGPADEQGNIRVTNTGLMFDQAVCRQILAAPTRLVNDFYALAHGVPHFVNTHQLGGGAVIHGNKALLGPGSGLGMATLVPELSARPGWRVVASEGGHANLAPASALETELLQWLMAEHSHVCWETVLSGSGLQNLYRAVAAIWGTQPEDLTPSDISTRGQTMQDPVCHQTLETFCSLLGSAAGNLALTVTAVGGVYIGGGILPQIKEFVQSSPLRRRFEERGQMSDYVAQIPILLVADPHPGLLGAFHCLQAAD